MIRAVVLAAALMSAAPAAAQQTQFTIWSGSAAGVYFPAAGALCRLVNQARGAVRCRVRATAGGAENLTALEAGDAQVGLAQSDWVAQADAEDLRLVMRLHTEALTILTRPDGPRRLADLNGKTVNVGPEGSSASRSLAAAGEAAGVSLTEMSAEHLSGVAAARAVCERRFDAAVYVIGHPSTVIAEAFETCDLAIMELTESVQAPFSAANIPGGWYRDIDRSRRSIGVAALVVARADAPDAAVYALTRAAIDGAADLGALHPALNEVTGASLSAAKTFGRLHPAATRAYRDAGLAP